jgi:hypothetical protein
MKSRFDIFSASIFRNTKNFVKTAFLSIATSYTERKKEEKTKASLSFELKI